MNVDSLAPGSFCWTDLKTTDAAGAKAFYSSLFGWTYDDMPMGEGSVYSMINLGGRVAGALYQDNTSPAPPHWALYISVPNADEAAEKAKSLGGTIMMEPFDVMEVGRMTVIQDPTGAVFCAWQAKTHHGFSVVDEPGAFCWGELNTRDTARAILFYRSLLDWSIRGNEDGSSQYTEFLLGEKPIGGMMAIQAEWGDAPPHWLCYFQVEDCDGIAAKAAENGGTLLVPGMDIPGTGRFSVIRDPQGSVFAIVQLTG